MGSNSRARSSGARERVVADDRRFDHGREVRAVVTAARRSARRAYAPYSGFAVGAALESADGAITCGFNIENAAYPLGVCAERAALLEWRSAAGSPIILVVIHTETAAPTTPCGLCRDALRRWAPDAKLYLSNRQGVQGPYRTADWLPAGGSEDA